MKLPMVLLIISFLILGGCSSNSNEQAPTTTKAHEPGWIVLHAQRALQDLPGCQVCHGSNFEGNSPVPACSVCHPFGGPPFLFHSPHFEPDLPWTHPSNHGASAKLDIKGCQLCHGQAGGPGSNPRFDRPVRSLDRGCESGPGCHNNADPLNSFNNGHNPRAAHPSFDPAALDKQDRLHWYGESIVYQATPGGRLKYYPLNHSTAGNMVAACSLCHGAQLQGGAGPACMGCHVLDPIANPSRCVSCHGPLPGQTQDVPLKPTQLAALAGRNDLLTQGVFRNFTGQLTARMKRDPSYVRINPLNAQSPFYFGPSAFINFSTASNLASRSSHLHHDTLPCADRQNNATCGGCHTINANPASNMTRHHGLMFSRGLGCANCHQFSFGSGGLSLGNFRECRDCHREHFCN